MKKMKKGSLFFGLFFERAIVYTYEYEYVRSKKGEERTGKQRGMNSSSRLSHHSLLHTAVQDTRWSSKQASQTLPGHAGRQAYVKLPCSCSVSFITVYSRVNTYASRIIGVCSPICTVYSCFSSEGFFLTRACGHTSMSNNYTAGLSRLMFDST